ncbi:MAG: hypothetical protein HC854_00850 [Flavobacterium sp.]|nr:hypothetical protein [Flavobacterium sp.]
MIIRSEKQYEDVDYNIKYEPNYCIDIEFTGVEFISLPSNINGLNIRKEQDIYLFNENKEYYVKASFCRVGVSQFDYTQDKISDLSLEYEEIIYMT